MTAGLRGREVGRGREREGEGGEEMCVGEGGMGRRKMGVLIGSDSVGGSGSARS